MVVDIERTILSSLIESDDIPQIVWENAEDVKEEIFIKDFHRYLLRHLKKAKNKQYPLKLMLDRVQEAVAGTEWEDDYLEVLAATPTASWRQYYEHLLAKHIQRKAKKLMGA